MPGLFPSLGEKQRRRGGEHFSITLIAKLAELFSPDTALSACHSKAEGCLTDRLDGLSYFVVTCLNSCDLDLQYFMFTKF